MKQVDKPMVAVDLENWHREKAREFGRKTQLGKKPERFLQGSQLHDKLGYITVQRAFDTALAIEQRLRTEKDIVEYQKQKESGVVPFHEDMGRNHISGRFLEYYVKGMLETLQKDVQEWLPDSLMGILRMYERKVYVHGALLFAVAQEYKKRLPPVGEKSN